jgi:hypothetical protein
MPRPRLARALALAAVSLGGCLPAAQLLPPAPAALREPLPVQASFGRSWDAAIDHFARQGIPIRTIERVSGLIVAEEMGVDVSAALAYADCGQLAGSATGASPWGPGVPPRAGDGRPVAAERASYNVLVRGDSSRSTVLVTVRWRVPDASRVSGDPRHAGRSIECSTRGVWERAFEAGVRDRAQQASPWAPSGTDD